VTTAPVQSFRTRLHRDPLAGHESIPADFAALMRQALPELAHQESCPLEDLRIHRIQPHYKSFQAYIVRRQAPGAPVWVIKNTSSADRARIEFEAMQFVARLFRTNGHGGEFHFGAIEPVAFLSEPPGIITRFQSGRSLRPIIDAALQSLPRSEHMRCAAHYVRGMARWLAVVRQADVHTGAGFTPESFLALTRRRVEDVRRRLGRIRLMGHVESCIERYLDRMPEADRIMLANRYPGHGDFCTQNFLVDDRETIYALDLGSFTYFHTDVDLAQFRIRLEHAIYRGLFVRPRAERLWRTFLETYEDDQRHDLHGLLSYLHEILWIMSANEAGRANGDGNGAATARRRFKGLRTTLGRALWLRGRLSWLRRLTGRPDADTRFWGARL